MRVASEWSDIEAIREVRVSWLCISHDGRQDEELLGTQIGNASAVTRALHCSVVMKRELSKKAKLLIFKTVFVPISPMVMNLG